MIPPALGETCALLEGETSSHKRPETGLDTRADPVGKLLKKFEIDTYRLPVSLAMNPDELSCWYDPASEMVGDAVGRVVKAEPTKRHVFLI